MPGTGVGHWIVGNHEIWWGKGGNSSICVMQCRGTLLSRRTIPVLRIVTVMGGICGHGDDRGDR